MSLHDELLAELRSAATRISLVASLADARLNFAGTDDLRVFVPDLHLLTNSTRTKYSYGTNDTDLLADVLTRIAALKARSVGRTVALFQVGDFLDLWREQPIATARRDAASRIVDDHPRLMNAFFNPTLKARFLLGNHDFDLARWPNFTAWERRYFLPPRGSTKATGMVVHGDILDWVEMLPDPVNQFFVYFFSPLFGAADHDLHDVKALIDRKNGRLDFGQQIAGPANFAAPFATADAPPGKRVNVTDHPFLEKAFATAQAANRAFGLSLRFMVIGHTHHARIALHQQKGEFFALVDCGAWIEDGHDSSGRSFRNQQIAALADNEFRIYQLER